MNAIVLDLPFPPSVNHYWKYDGRSRRAVISRKGRIYKTTVGWIAKQQGVRTIKGGVLVAIVLYCPDWRQRDADNTLKAILDSLRAAGAFEDDSFIVRLTITKCKATTKRGSVSVRINEISESVTLTPSGAWITTEGS